MAKKKEESSKVVLERAYVVPLHKQTLKVPPFRKAEKAAKTLREFISKHMKSDDVKIGRHLNMKLWEHGMKNPPHKIKVIASKDDKGKVFVELEGAPKEVPKPEAKKKSGKEEPKREISKAEERIEQKAEEAREEKAEEAKIVEHEEIRELQKEHPKQHAPKVPLQHKEQIQRPSAPKHE